MKDLRPGGRRIADEPGIVDQDPRHLPGKAGVLTLTSSQVEEFDLRADAELRNVQVVAADEVKANTPCQESLGQAKRVGTVAAARQQAHFTLGGRPRQTVRLHYSRVQAVVTPTVRGMPG